VWAFGCVKNDSAAAGLNESNGHNNDSGDERTIYSAADDANNNNNLVQGNDNNDDDAAANSINLKDMEKMVVPDLLAFRKHLYNLHSTAFRGEESFGATVRSVLDDVLNGSASGSSLLDDGDAEGGRRTAELLAKHVDIRFKDAKASAGMSSGSGAAASSVPGGLIDVAMDFCLWWEWSCLMRYGGGFTRHLYTIIVICDTIVVFFIFITMGCIVIVFSPIY